MRIPFFVGTRN